MLDETGDALAPTPTTFSTVYAHFLGTNSVLVPQTINTSGAPITGHTPFIVSITKHYGVALPFIDTFRHPPRGIFY